LIMGLIEVPRRRIRANFIPDFPVVLDPRFAQFLPQRLVNFANGEYDLITGTMLTRVGAGAFDDLSGEYGRGLRFGDVGGATYLSAPVRAETYNSFTMVWIGQVPADGIVVRDGTVTGGSIPIWRNAGTFDVRQAGADLTNSGTWLADKDQVIVLTVAGTEVKLYANGSLTVSGSIAGWTEAFVSPWVLHRNGNNASGITANTRAWAVFARPFPDDIAQEISARPARLFKPANDSIWVSAGAPAGTTYNVSIAETASAVDVLSAILAGLASIAETGTASDASSAALIGTAAVTEAGTAADSQAASAVFVAAGSDALAAADTTSTGGAITSAAVAETAAATDSTGAIAAFLASVAEIGATVDSQSATAVLNAAWSDALNAADSQNWGGSVISVSLSEALNALDSQSASAVFAASVSESGAALDSTSCVLIANASISEVLAALDSSSVRLITSASIAEALSALDTTSVVNLNFIAAQSHILAGRERVTVLVGKERILVIY
jgi:hypothetical protein